MYSGYLQRCGGGVYSSLIPPLPHSLTHFCLASVNTAGSSVAMYILLLMGNSEEWVSSYHRYQSFTCKQQNTFIHTTNTTCHPHFIGGDNCQEIPHHIRFTKDSNNTQWTLLLAEHDLGKRNACSLSPPYTLIHSLAHGHTHTHTHTHTTRVSHMHHVFLNVMILCLCSFVCPPNMNPAREGSYFMLLLPTRLLICSKLSRPPSSQTVPSVLPRAPRINPLYMRLTYPTIGVVSVKLRPIS